MDIYCNYEFSGGQAESRKLLKKVISFYDDENIIERLEYSEKGKPYIPEWYNFSISHSDNCWAILIDNEECGLDIQYPRNCSQQSIAERWYSPEDAVLVNTNPDDFWRVWTRREACVKAVGGSVMDDIPSVMGDVVELKGQEWNVGDIELIGNDNIPYAAICTKQIAQTVNYYKI